jgi:hypothetical protein
LGELWRSQERVRQEGLAGRKVQHLQLAEPPESFYDVLDEFPNLRIVRTGFTLSPTAVRAVARLPGLEYVAVECGGQVDCSPLAGVTSLGRLDFWTGQPPIGLAALGELPNLKTAIFQIPGGVDDQSLAAIAKWPHLKTLALAFSVSTDVNHPVTEAGIEALRESRSLETLYLGGQPMPPHLDLLTMARKELPRIDVRPALALDSPPLIFFLWPCLGIGLGIGLVLVDQFRGPVSRLAPGFVPRHALVAGGWALLGIVPSTIFGSMNGLPPGVAFLLSTSMLTAALNGPIQSFTATHLRNAGWRVKVAGNLFATATFGMMALVIWPALAQALFAMNPWGVAFLVAVSGGSLAVALLGLSELGQVSVPGKSLTSALQQTPYRDNWMFASRGREQQIEAWRREPGYWNWWRRIARWRCGNPPFRDARFAVMICLGTAAGVSWVSLGGLGTRAVFSIDQLRSPLLILAPMIVFVTSVRQAMAWRVRVLSLGLESLRPPYDRKALAAEWAAAFALDLLPAAVLMSLAEGVLVNLDSTWRVNWNNVPRDALLLALAFVPCALGLGSAIVVIARDWLRLLVLAAAGIVSSVGFGVATAWLYPQLSQVSVIRLEQQLWIPALVGLVLVASMWRQWRTMELDRPA